MPAHVYGLIDDLFFSPRLASVATRLGYRLTLIESADGVTAEAFVGQMHKDAPGLVVVDLNSRLPWLAWLQAAKAEPELAAIPWLAFGSHKDTELLAKAKQAGADRVVAKSKFASELPDLMQTILDK